MSASPARPLQATRRESYDRHLLKEEPKRGWESENSLTFEWR